MLTEDLLQLALAKAQGEETSQAHSVSCNIFGAIAPLLDAKLIMQTYLHKAMALCQVGTDFKPLLLRSASVRGFPFCPPFPTNVVFLKLTRRLGHRTQILKCGRACASNLTPSLDLLV